MSADAHRAAMALLRGQRRVYPGDLRALARAYLEAIRDRDTACDRVAEMAQADRNIDEERTHLRDAVKRLMAELDRWRDHVAAMHVTMNEMTRRLAELEKLEQSHRPLATIAMHARTWRNSQLSDKARAALIEAVDAMGAA